MLTSSAVPLGIEYFGSAPNWIVIAVWLACNAAGFQMVPSDAPNFGADSVLNDMHP